MKLCAKGVHIIADEATLIDELTVTVYLVEAFNEDTVTEF